MKNKSRRENKGQFSIIAALLVSVILIAAVIMTYSMIRHNPSQEPPKVLTSIGEINLAIKRILEFTVGYYGSILQVTGNTTYAKNLASSYLRSGLVNIARSHPEWNPSFDIDFQQISTRWFMPVSYSMGNISVTYSLSGLGIDGVKYETSSLLKATVLEPMNSSEARVLVTREDNEPELRLRTENFFFYSYSYSDSTWKLVNPESDPIAYSNGTYLLEIPSEVDQDAYSFQVVDPRGIAVTAFYSEESLASGIPQYSYTFTWNSSLYSSLTRDTLVVEALQNGTLRCLGQNLLTNGKPIPPIPVKALHVNQTVDGVKYEVPFQVEDWGSNYRMPLGLTSNASVFSSRNMPAFLVNHKVQKVTLWWDGQDTATQTSYAWKNKYFVNDDPDPNYGFLSNGILDLTVDAGGNAFTVTSTLGTSTSTAEFMRINGEEPVYGSDPAYVIHHGVVRDIVQAEAEWSSGVLNCPNVYSQIVLTLPANATYYTYALRLIFVNSSQSRTITDLSPIQLSSGWIPGTLRSLTENGTSGGYPVVAETYMDDTNLFYNFSSPSTGWAHHWSEYISGNNGGGMIFTDSSNLKLYTFDSSKYAGDKTGALSVTTEQRTAWKTPTAVYDKCGETSPYVASRAIDGNTRTSWRHSTTCNHWIILDMGKTMNISRIRIYQRSYDWGGSEGIEVYVSDDPENWGSYVWTGRIDGWGWEYSGQFNAQGRYVKLVSKSSSSSRRLYEVQVEAQERRATIEFNPVERYQASFTDPLDVTWHGAVVTFDSDSPQDTIYPSSGGNIGLWVIVEHPPIVTVS